VRRHGCQYEQLQRQRALKLRGHAHQVLGGASHAVGQPLHLGHHRPQLLRPFNHPDSFTQFSTRLATLVGYTTIDGSANYQCENHSQFGLS